MKLDEVRIALRPRSSAEALDLAVAIVRRHTLPLALLLGLGAAPFVYLNSQIFGDLLTSNPELFVKLYTLNFLVLLEAPWATALATLYLGQITFQSSVSTPRMLLTFLKAIPQMILFQVVARGACIFMFILLPVVFWGMRFANEVILLERTKITRTMKRQSSLASRARVRIIAQWALDLFYFWLGWHALAGMLISVTDLWHNRSLTWFELLETGESLFVPPLAVWETHAAMWLLIGFFTVVRFVTYLDTRIRQEGWDIELKLRAQAAGLKKAESW